MNYTFARITKKILTLVERDLETVWKKSSSLQSDNDDLPLVAVDWSELLVYATAQSPALATVPDRWRHDLPSLHYAALDYLFFRLPCRLLLLPPYAWEMTDYLKRTRHNFLAARALPSSVIVSFREKLVKEYQALERHSPQLKQLLDGTLGENDIDDRLKRQVVQLGKKHLPEIYLNLQATTLHTLSALRHVLNPGSGTSRRVIMLGELDPRLAIVCERRFPDHVPYWLRYMNNERENAPTRNRIDAIALAYLEILHQHLFWEQRILLFATRSRAMFRVMGYHPGIFPSCDMDVYVKKGPREAIMAEDMEHSYSSARPWEYFGELGFYFYLPTKHTERGLRELSPWRRRLNLSPLEALGSPDKTSAPVSTLGSEYIAATLDLGQLRGYLDLQGSGPKVHWEQRLKTPDDLILLQIVKLMSDERKFIIEKEEIVNGTLTVIDRLLESIGIETAAQRRHTISTPSLGSLLDNLLSVIDYATVLRKHFRRDGNKLIVLFQAFHEANGQLHNAVHDLMSLVERREPTDLTRDYQWMSAVGMYFRGYYEQAADLLRLWLLSTKAQDASVNMLLLSVTLMADCFKSINKDQSALEVLDGIIHGQRRKLRPDHRLVWQNQRAALTSLLIEGWGEAQQSFPHEPEKCVTGLLESLLTTNVPRFKEDPKFKFWCINNCTYLFARCIRPRRENTQWLMDHIPNVKDMAYELADYCKTSPVPRYLHTVGYLYLKLYMLQMSGIQASEDDYASALEFCERAKEEAARHGDKVTEELADKHKRFAKDLREKQC